MSYKDTMKLGYVGFINPLPPEITDQVEQIKWHTTQVANFGGSVFHQGPFPPLTDDQGKLDDLKAHIDGIGVELELGCPYVYQLTGPDKEQARADIKKLMKKAHFLGVKIMRAGYGRLKMPTSRFNKSFPLEEHKKFIIDNLKEAAKIFEAEEIYFAMENHCDFIGREFVEFFTAVDNKYIGCALDTANAFTTFSNADDENELLAPFAVTTHIKDMQIQESGPDMVPFTPYGCALGEGHVDIPRAIDLLDKKSPMANGLHLIVEQGWFNFKGVEDKEQLSRDVLAKSFVYLKNVMGRK